MKYDIVPIVGDYHGIGRSLLATDLYTKRNKNQYDYLLNMYYEYLSYIQQYPTKDGLAKLICFCNEFSLYAIECEVIVYDSCELSSAFGYALEFLGIDIVYEMSESLLSDCVNNDIWQFLNENGLCNLEIDLEDIISLLDCGTVKWEPCYVYRVKIRRNTGDG